MNGLDESTIDVHVIVRDDTHLMPRVKICDVTEIPSPVCPISNGLKTTLTRNSFDILCDTWIEISSGDLYESKPELGRKKTDYRFRSTRCLQCPIRLSKKTNKGLYDTEDVPKEIEIRSYDEKGMEVNQSRKAGV